MRLRVEAGRARTRTSVKVIIGVTSALVVGLALFNRGYLAPYDTAHRPARPRLGRDGVHHGVRMAVADDQAGQCGTVLDPPCPGRLLEEAGR